MQRTRNEGSAVTAWNRGRIRQGAAGFVILLSLSLLVTACTQIPPVSASRYAARFDSFVSRVEAEAMEYSPEEWASADDRFEWFADELYSRFRDDLSQSESNLINRLRGRYFAVRTRAAAAQGLESLQDRFRDAADRLDGFFSGLFGD